MNKKILIIVIAIIILIGILVGIILNRNNDINITIGGTKYTVIKDGYSEFKSTIISNYEEYLTLVDYIETHNSAYGNEIKFNTKKYSKKYFNENSLAIINICIGTSADKLKGIDISIENNKLICTPNIEESFSLQADIDGQLILVEIDKDITELKINE